MISDCVYCGILDLNETGFFQDTFELLLVVVPAATCFILWRIFVTNKSGPRGGIEVLGLDDSSFVYSDLSQSDISTYLRLLYCLIGISTFVLGLLTTEIVKYLQSVTW